MAGPIDINGAAAKYAENTPEASGRWRERTAAASREWEQNAKSTQAEEYWKQRTQDAINRSARLQGLQKVSAMDFEMGVAGGEAAYRDKVSRSAPKWGARFAPFAAEIDRIVPTLPPKTGDVRTNVANRVTPIAEALRRLKESGATGMVSAPSPMMARRY